MISTQLVAAPLKVVEQVGEQARFYVGALRRMPLAVLRYPREMLKILAEVSFGSGALVVIGGTIGVVVFLTSFAGSNWVSRATHSSVTSGLRR